jgi:hypothetical protein
MQAMSEQSAGECSFEKALFLAILSYHFFLNQHDTKDCMAGLCEVNYF